LSAGEAYVIVAAAFLHDSGMVVAEREKIAILGSPEWNAWVAGGGASARWTAIRDLRAGDERLPHDAIRNYLADLQTRYLIAEFVRSQHAARASFVIDSHETEWPRPSAWCMRTTARSSDRAL
ncbi:MAG: hypothetical protein WKG01_42815, partial [Kofleriaceae bacterium]